MRLTIRQDRPSRFAVAAAAAVLGVTAAAAQASLVNVDFNGGDFNGIVGPTQVGPAQVGAAGDTWNGLSGNGQHYPATLVYADGSAGPSMTFTGLHQGYNDNSAGGGNAFHSTDLANLFQDFNVNSGTITLTNLPASTAFDLYVYSEPNQSNHTLTVTAGPDTKTTAPSDTTINTLQEGQNYLHFTPSSDATGTLSFVLTNGAGGEADVNGFQLQTAALPEPTACALLGLGLPLVLRRRRRR